MTPSPTYRALWAAIAGACRDVQHTHPGYFTPGRAKDAQNSITKRAAGQLAALTGCHKAGPGDRLTQDADRCLSAVSRRKPTNGLRRGPGSDNARPILLAWPPEGLTCAGRASLRRLLRQRRNRFVGLHRGRGGIIYVAVRPA
jgi:hypothetical protein